LLSEVFGKDIAMNSQLRFFPLVFLVLAVTWPLAGLAQDGKVALHVTPHQAYLFVDGSAISEVSKHHTLSLTPGTHKIELVNYGYTPETHNVTIAAGKTTDLDVTLQPVSDKVSGPFGAITIEGADRDAILLNGTTPQYFVGHGDEFNHNWWWKQELVVPPGKYDAHVMSGDKDVWSGSIDVPADKRVVVDIPKGVRKTVDWPRGEKLSAIPRFTAGTASATVAVAKPTAQFSVSTAQVNCGDSSQLKWSSTDAPGVEISGLGSVASSGETSVDPKQTTTYTLTATGPGGTATSSSTVDVNNAVQANLELSPAEVHYKRVGNKVVEDDGSTLNWTASNASNISIDPLGTVDANGSRALQPAVDEKTPGPVDKTITYTLNAANGCGGTVTRTAALHIVGSIENPQMIAMDSIYFPTNKPRRMKSENALVPSQRESLKAVADAFKTYLEAEPDAHLVLSGHADRRGPKSYNQALSERRADLAKDFLIQQGVPAANIGTQAYGKEKNLTTEEVKALLEKDPDLTAQQREKVLRHLTTIVLANNRRVDITLSTTGQESARMYPFASADYAALVYRGKPLTTSGVENAAMKEKVKN
jgi:outer membrane protein OmpA-like peptidoglycan-associated protein